MSHFQQFLTIDPTGPEADSAKRNISEIQRFALLSNRGASHRLLRLVGDALEHEQTLKRVCTGREFAESDIDAIVGSLCATANLRPIFFLWRPLLPDPKDGLILELAVESRADFPITFNTRDFYGADRFGVRVIRPREFLATIGALP